MEQQIPTGAKLCTCASTVSPTAHYLSVLWLAHPKTIGGANMSHPELSW